MKLTWPLPTEGELKAGFLLSPAEIHLWCANLDDQKSNLERFLACLSEEEQQRAMRYHFESDRHRFVARRALLRSLLEQYLNIPAGDLLFLSNPYGRPFLDPKQAPAGLDFNLSHSNGIALFAFALQRQVGVDIEIPHREIEYLQVATRSFLPWRPKLWPGCPSISARPLSIAAGRARKRTSKGAAWDFPCRLNCSTSRWPRAKRQPC